MLRIPHSYIRRRSAAISPTAAVLFLGFLSHDPVRANVGPPLRIGMPANTEAAASGQMFAGVFEVEIGEDGLIDDIEISGDGWQVITVDKPAGPTLAAKGVMRIPIRAVPLDAGQPLTLSVTYDGRRVSRTFRLGPETFARRGKDAPTVLVRPGRTTPPDAADADLSSPAVTTGGAIPLRFTGRIIYDRPTDVNMDNGSPIGPFTEEGVHAIWVQVMDEDDISDEVIWEGYTDKDGHFDSGNIQWDDCDVTGCDDPDLYLRWECDTPVVNVQDAEDITEPDYSWSTVENVIDDFTGSFHDFGWVKPFLPAHMPVLHMHNSIHRARLFIEFKSGGGYVVPEVDVLYPDGDNAFYDSFFEEIHIGIFRRWMEATHTHEYGHHFLESFAVNTDTNYCNGICDDPDDCGHCIWCEENATDAWNEGWPNWLADVVTRDYANEYTFTDGTPYTALVGRNLENINTCGEDGTFHDAEITEGFATALLIDIEDDTQDPISGEPCFAGQYNGVVIERQDCLAMGPEEIFNVTVNLQPTTPAQFITYFQLIHPESMPALYVTARTNTFPADLFPEDTDPPGAVQSALSSTHPSGQGGPSPCITVDWDTPPDDVTGANAYSIEWTTSSAGLEPDTSCEFKGTCVSLTDGPFRVGDYYLSIKALDRASHWSNEWATFGPFTVNDCNGNGITDICEITCDASTYSDNFGCSIPANFCIAESDCGIALDCNTNAVPDDCDIAHGTSADCNENGIPDECELMKHWATLSGSWHDGGNWAELATPSDGDHICIEVPDYDATVTYAGGFGSLQVQSLSCTENFRMSPQGGAADLTIDDGGFINGDLELHLFGSSVVRLTLNDDLIVQGMLHWEHGSLIAPDTSIAVLALGGMSVTGSTILYALTLFLPAPTLSAGQIQLQGGATMINTSTYDHEGDGVLLAGVNTETFNNQGTFVRSAGDGVARITCKLSNSGEVRVETGTLQIDKTVTSTGTMRGLPGATLDFRAGGNELLPGSTLIADKVIFSGSPASSTISGTVDVTSEFNVHNGLGITITSDANVLNYGPIMRVTSAATFDAVVGDTVYFDELSGGTIRWNSGDPIVTNSLSISGQFFIPPSLTVNGDLTWLARGIFLGPGVIDLYGDTAVTDASAFQHGLSNAELNNYGTVALIQAISLSNGAKFNNMATGVLDVQREDTDSAIIIGTSDLLDNAGTIVKSAGTVTSTIHPITTNTGTIETRIGLLEFRNLTQTAGEIVLNGGDFGMFQLSNPQPLRLMGGELRGAGTVIGVVENSAGTIKPGLSAGTLTVNGNCIKGAGSTLAIEIGGTTQGVDYDWLDVTGTAALAGTLEVTLIGGFIPNSGDTCEILTAGAVTSVFDSVVFTNPPANVDLSVTYAAGSVTIEAMGPVPGDCDGDGDVDLDDFIDLDGCLAGPNGGLGAGCDCFDFDASGDVTLLDYAQFMTNF